MNLELSYMDLRVVIISDKKIDPEQPEVFLIFKALCKIK